MQSDIVEELNESARRLIWLFNLENESGSIQTIREAATEITALRDRVARLGGNASGGRLRHFLSRMNLMPCTAAIRCIMKMFWFTQQPGILHGTARMMREVGDGVTIIKPTQLRLMWERLAG